MNSANVSYQALARTWRPRDFATTIGQDHVVRALTHALDSQRLHHAYLFTGTRGVGKTTLARILAKALNCRTGISSRPCNQCDACLAIDAGRFIDYIEMDAASNRGVDDMTALLERALQSPSQARFKVYMIDEVHMLTGHAFNAMLKTLEEPPEFVKFILATTDPQKVPVTVLSRCLQFNLKAMAPAAIAGRLSEILAAESITAEPAALRLLAQAARGSMRDGLSLLDQAIAYGGGRVSDDAVRGMLGTIDSLLLTRLLDALIADDAAALLALADEMSARSFSYGQALRDLASLLHRIALAQQLVRPTAGAKESNSRPARSAAGSAGSSDGEDEDLSDDAEVQRLARQLAPEDVQLYYQIALHGRNELNLAPDEYAGFTMTLLRLLAFKPIDGAAERVATSVAQGPAMNTASSAGNSGADRPENRGPRASAAPQRPQAPALRSASYRAAVGVTSPSIAPTSPTAAHSSPASSALASAPTSSSAAEWPATGRPTDWPALAAQLNVSGLARELAARSELVAHDGDHFRLRVALKTLADSGTVERLRNALTAHFGRAHRLSVEVGATAGATAADLAAEQRAEQQRRAEEAIYGDPFVKHLIENFGASVDPHSIHPVDVRVGDGADSAGAGGNSGQVVEGKQS